MSENNKKAIEVQNGVIDENLDEELNIDIEEELIQIPKTKRILTNEDVLKYEPMVEKYIRDSVVKNWNEAHSNKKSGDTSLGNTGYTVNDIRQQLRAEICVALHNYNPNYRTKEGRSVKESTFVFAHLFNRVGQLMKRLTRPKKSGYGVWHIGIEEAMWETEKE